MGRPSKYTPETVTEICERLAKGEPLAVICRDDHMPHPTTVRDWMAADESISRAIARAREDGEDAIAATCLTIADDATNDWMERNGHDSPGYTLNGEHVQRSKLRIDTRLKLLAKWNPKKYGDKQSHEITGANGGPLQVLDPSRLSDAAIAEIVSASKPDKP